MISEQGGDDVSIILLESSDGVPGQGCIKVEKEHTDSHGLNGFTRILDVIGAWIRRSGPLCFILDCSGFPNLTTATMLVNEVLPVLNKSS